MTVKELITLLMMQDPEAHVVMVDETTPDDQDEWRWHGVAKVESAQDTTFYVESKSGIVGGYRTERAVRLVGF